MRNTSQDDPQEPGENNKYVLDSFHIHKKRMYVRTHFRMQHAEALLLEKQSLLNN